VLSRPSPLHACIRSPAVQHELGRAEFDEPRVRCTAMKVLYDRKILGT
jgi:hypothetical protein